MKLITQFTTFIKQKRDIDSTKISTSKVQYDFWEDECKSHPTSSACKIYPV